MTPLLLFNPTDRKAVQAIQPALDDSVGSVAQGLGFVNAASCIRDFTASLVSDLQRCSGRRASGQSRCLGVVGITIALEQRVLSPLIRSSQKLSFSPPP
jgi:hypothetical protein